MYHLKIMAITVSAVFVAAYIVFLVNEYTKYN